MRRELLFFGTASALWTALASPVYAQVSGAERAAARDLFKQGDELQREARFDEALTKFQRAEQLYSAPTNQLRIAECDAALGRLAESEETYRTVLRTPLPPGSPPAFQAAVDQARAELEQVEPRVPKLTIVMQPGNVVHPTLEVDGQSVPAALLGEAVPLDPGSHRIAVSAAGYAPVEQVVLLKEGEARVVLLALKPAPEPATATGVVPAPPAPASLAAMEPPATEPPPPAVVPERTDSERHLSWKGALFGAHLGGEWMGGTVPQSSGPPINATELVSGAIAYGLDAGFRFARHWYVGLTLDHANYMTKATTTIADSTLVGAVVGATVSPDRPSLYGEAGLGVRWFTVRGNDDGTFSGPEFELGLGIWLPLAQAVRLLPKATFTLGDFSGNGDAGTTSAMPGHADNNKSSTGHTIFALTLTGFYNIDM